MKTGLKNNVISLNYEQLKSHAQRMRRNPTDAETLLWKVLFEDKLGVRFRRQHIIGDYIVDFACLRHGLIIEIMLAPSSKFKLSKEPFSFNQEDSKSLDSVTKRF